MRSYRYNLKRKHFTDVVEDSEEGSDGETFSKKSLVLDACDVQIQEEGKTSKEDYSELKSMAKAEFAKKVSSSSRSQITHCLQQTYSNRCE